MKKFIVKHVKEETSVLRTIRMKKTMYDKLDKLSITNDISINRLINQCIEYALDNMEDDNATKESEKKLI